MKLNKLMNTLLIFLILIICVGTVSAEGIILDNDASLDAANDESFSVNDALSESQDNSANDASEDIISDELTVENSKDKLTDGEYGSFKDLQDEISSSTKPINLSQDYKYDPSSDNKDGISIWNKYVTINAKGHTLDGDNLARIFKLSGTATLVLNDAIIKNGFSEQYGGAIYSSYKLILNNVTFINNNLKSDLVSQDGGAIYLDSTSAASSITIKNCTFVNNSATGCGGAIATNYNSGLGRYILNISDTLFENNLANSSHGLGGAVYATGVHLDNVTFIGNKAGYGTGGGGAVSSPLIKSVNSRFINNTAVTGGALSNAIASSIATTNFNIVNSTFDSNKADLAGGAIKIADADQVGDILIENSSFVNNDGGRYGGGAIISPTTNVKNSNFTNNSAFNYGGAISSQKLDVENCKFENNNAKHSGAIFAVNFTIKDSQFEGNEAADESIITTSSDFKSEGTDLPKVNTYDQAYNPFWSTYWWGTDGALHCTEHELENEKVESFYTSDLSYVINYVDRSELKEHVKILYYLCNIDEEMLSGGFRNDEGQYKLSSAIWRLCSEDLSNPINETVKKVMEVYNSGFRVPDNRYILPNGTMVDYEFHLFINPQYVQNYLRYEQTTEDVNLTVSKETLNKTVEIGQEVQFRINVTNNMEQDLEGVFVNDSDFDDGLVYQSYLNETGEWIFNQTSKIWSLVGVLKGGESASFIVIFKTTKVGELVNNVSAGIGNYVFANSTNTTNVTNITENNDTNDTNDTNVTNVTNDTEKTNKTDTPKEDTPKEDTPKEDTPVHKTTIDKKVPVSKTVAGNPLFALVLMFALAFVPKRRS